MNAINEINALEPYVENKSETMFPVFDIYLTISFIFELDYNSNDEIFQIGFINKNKIVFNEVTLPRNENNVIFKDFIVDCSDLFFVNGMIDDPLGIILKLNDLFNQIGQFLDLYRHNPRCFVHYFVVGHQGLDDLCNAFISLTDLSRIAVYKDLIFDTTIQGIVNEIVSNETFPLSSFVTDCNWRFIVEHYTIIELEVFIGINASKGVDEMVNQPNDYLNNGNKEIIQINEEPLKNNDIRTLSENTLTCNYDNDGNNGSLSPFWQFWASIRARKKGTLCFNLYAVKEATEIPDPKNPISLFLKYSFRIIDELSKNTKVCSFFRACDYVTNIPPFMLPKCIMKIVYKIGTVDKRIEALRYASDGYWGKYHETIQQANEETIENVHTTLTIISFCPIVGTAAAVIDFSLYFIEAGYHVLILKDDVPDNLKSDLAWSVLGIIPFGKIGKYAGKTMESINEIEHLKKVDTIMPLFQRESNLVKELNIIKKQLCLTTEELADSTRKMNSYSSDMKKISSNINQYNYYQYYTLNGRLTAEQSKYGLSILQKQDAVERYFKTYDDLFEIRSSMRNAMRDCKLELNEYYNLIISNIDNISLNSRALFTEYCEEVFLKSLRNGKLKFTIDDFTEWKVNFVINYVWLCIKNYQSIK